MSVRFISGDELGPQLRLGEIEPCEELFNPVLIDDGSNGFLSKPPHHTALWTSTEVNGSSDWIRWREEESYGSDLAHTWRLTPDPLAVVIEIDTVADLMYVREQYAHGYGENHPLSGLRKYDEYIDFALIARDYAGVHLTEEGQWRTRLSEPYNLYGWDCESTVWLKWSFVKVEDLGINRLED
jgi:hypothetical protein